MVSLSDIASVFEGLELDFWMKYGLIISNFFVIIFIIIAKKYYSNKEAPTERKAVLFVIAHPDDEAMFFIPTIEGLKGFYDLHILCLSNGNGDGLGKVREKELVKSAKYLGFSKWDVLDYPELQDGFDKVWQEKAVADRVQKYIDENNIKGVITFDGYGISGHPNHIATYKGVRELISAEEYKEKNKELKLYTLVSVNIIRKYIGILDFFLSALNGYVYINLKFWKSYRAMEAHESQFVWFRRLFVIFSRYTFINTLDKLQ